MPHFTACYGYGEPKEGFIDAIRNLSLVTEHLQTWPCSRNKAPTTQSRVRGFRVVILSVTSLNPWWASTISTMVIAPSKKKTISLTSADARDNSDTAISVEGAYSRNSNELKLQTPKLEKREYIFKRKKKTSKQIDLTEWMQLVINT